MLQVADLLDGVLGEFQFFRVNSMTQVVDGAEEEFTFFQFHSDASIGKQSKEESGVSYVSLAFLKLSQFHPSSLPRAASVM